MKAVVMDINNKDMIIMDKNGCFYNVKYDNVSRIGEEILFLEPTIKILPYFRKITAIAAMLLLMIGSGYGAVSYYTPYSYVDVDINPSVELVLNRYLKVLDIQNLNEDANKIVPDKLKFKHKDMQTAINELIDNAETQKIITTDKDNDILFTVSSKNKKTISNIKQKLESTSKKKLEKVNNRYDILLEEVSLNKHDEAKSQKVSPGRIILFEKLKEVKPDAKLEDVQKTPVRETLKLIKKHKKEEQEKKTLEKKDKKEEINKNKPLMKEEAVREKSEIKRTNNIKPIFNNIIEKNETKRVKQAINQEVNNNKKINEAKISESGINEQLRRKKVDEANVNNNNYTKNNEQIFKRIKERIKNNINSQTTP